MSVVDQSEDAFRRLGPGFEGRTVPGVGFDPDVLRNAGIENADGFAAVSSGDNSNVISARVARETFGVESVAARIYDPGRAEVYQRLGIPTVATVRWTADQLLRLLMPEGSLTEWVDPSGSVRLAEVHFSPKWIGHSVAALELASRGRIAFITRYGEAVLPGPSTALQQGDLVHVLMRIDDAPHVSDVFERGPEVH